MFAERVQERFMRQLARVPRAEPPADNLAGFEIQYDCEVMPAALEPQVGEVLHPSMRVNHAGIVEARPGPQLVAELRVALQGVRWGGNLCCCRPAVTALFGWGWHRYAGEGADASSLLFIPTEMDG